MFYDRGLVSVSDTGVQEVMLCDFFTKIRKW